VALSLSGLLVGVQESVERAWAADPAGVGMLWAWQGPAVAFGTAAAVMGTGAWLIARLRGRD
jgi:hypothetical protein